jgi:hypothetical protein
MKLTKSIILALMAISQLAVAGSLNAKTTADVSKIDKAKVRMLVDEFYANEALKERLAAKSPFNTIFGLKPLHDDPNCPQHPGPSSCIQAVCNHLSRYDCDDQSDLREIAGICQNVDGRCIDAMCSRLSTYDCDDKSDIRDIAQMCRSSNANGDCIAAVCERLSRYDCDDKSDLRDIAGMCQGVYRGDCIREVCSHLSSYDCDDKSDLREIVNQCKGIH